MTHEQKLEALELLQQQYLTGDDSPETANRFLNFLETLRNNPGEFWNEFFDDPSNFLRTEAKAIIGEHGTALTFTEGFRIFENRLKNQNRSTVTRSHHRR